MVHRGIKFVHAAVLAVATVLAFLVVSELDERTVLGHRAMLSVDRADGSTSGAGVVRALTEFADRHDTVIARSLPDLEDSEGRRHLYLAVGDRDSAAASWQRDGYPDFGQRVDTEVHPMTALGNRDPRGVYYLIGPGSEAAAVAEFGALGLSVTVAHPLAPSELWSVYTDGPLTDVFLTTALALVTLTGAGVLLSARSYGVLRLHGLSLTGAFLRDLRQLRRSWLISAGLLTVLVAVALGFLNGWARTGLYAAVAVGIAAVLGLTVLAAHAAALALVFRTALPGSLKGEVPVRAVTLTAYAVRIPALLLVVGLVGSVVTAGGDLLERREVWKAYARTGDATGVRITGSVSFDDLPGMERAMGRRLHQADREGKVVMAGRLPLGNLAGADVPGELLVVNEAFLAEQPLHAPDGHRHQPDTHKDATDGKSGESGGGKVRLLVPEALGGSLPRLLERTPSILRPADPGRVPRSDIETRLLRDGQRVFTYTPGDRARDGSGEDRSFVRDPVVLVVPAASGHLTEVNYYAFATRNQLFFPDPADIHDILREDESMRTYIAALLPVKQKAAVATAEAARTFRLQLFELLAGTAVLLITAVGVCAVHTRSHARTVLVRHLVGWPFPATHRTLLAVEAAVLLLLAGWLPARIAWENQELSGYTARGIPPPRPLAEITGTDVVTTAGLAVTSLGVLFCALVLFHRRIVREGIGASRVPVLPRPLRKPSGARSRT
ncbi:hypothetical protein [Streptomyces uncialis]|uniref:hypothetical protein n=1 Tax=Streptomyces uncialis TaxID=1048205 RepID=UPI0011610803|nr:hypothetical protein [Streptomyces uncialis]